MKKSSRKKYPKGGIIKPIELPNVNVYGTKDKGTDAQLNSISGKNSPDRFNIDSYEKAWASWEDSGKPKITPLDKTNMMFGAGGHGKGRAYYLPDKNEMFIRSGVTKDYTAELSHARQVKDGTFRSDAIKYPTSDVYDKAYDDPTSNEYNAHSVIEPMLKQKYGFPKGGSVPDYTGMGIEFMKNNTNLPGQPISKRDDFKGNFLSKKAEFYASGDIKARTTWDAQLIGDSPHADKSLSPRKRDYKEMYDLYKYYFGQPLEHNILTKSKYYPSNAKENLNDYVAINDDEFKKQVIDIATRENIKQGETKNVSGYTKFNQPVGADMRAPRKELVGKVYERTSPGGRKYSGVYGLTKEQEQEKFDKHYKTHSIGNFRVGRGKDDKGEYVSYYDVFDIAKGNKKSRTLGSAKPFEIYDRIYTKEYDMKKKYGAGGTLQGIGGAMSAIPTPWTQIGGAAINMLGGILGNKEQEKAAELARQQQAIGQAGVGQAGIMNQYAPTFPTGGEVDWTGAGVKFMNNPDRYGMTEPYTGQGYIGGVAPVPGKIGKWGIGRKPNIQAGERSVFDLIADGLKKSPKIRKAAAKYNKVNKLEPYAENSWEYRAGAMLGIGTPSAGMMGGALYKVGKDRKAEQEDYASGGITPNGTPIEIEQGEVMRDPNDGTLAKVSDSAPTHSQGGVDTAADPGTQIYGKLKVKSGRFKGLMYKEAADKIRKELARLDKN